MQFALDRGEELDWFSSTEIIVETVVAAFAFYLFIVHTLTAREPFIRPLSSRIATSPPACCSSPSSA